MAPELVKYWDCQGVPVNESREFGEPSFMVLHPVVPGETIRRFMKARDESGYAAERRFRRPDGWVYDAAICQRILIDLTNYIQHWAKGSFEWDMLDSAIRHMTDTMNEELPMQVREDHYDLAGSAMWQAISQSVFGTSMSAYAAPCLSLWLKGGGA